MIKAGQGSKTERIVKIIKKFKIWIAKLVISYSLAFLRRSFTSIIARLVVFITLVGNILTVILGAHLSLNGVNYTLLSFT